MDPEKPSFRKFIKNIPEGTLRQQLGYVDPETNRLFLYRPEPEEIITCIQVNAVCSPETLGAKLKLHPQQVSEVIQANTGKRELQIRHIICSWIEANENKATVQALMEGLWHSDDTKALVCIQGMDFEVAQDRKAEADVHAVADNGRYPPDLHTGSRHISDTGILVQQAESPGYHRHPVVTLTSGVLAQRSHHTGSAFDRTDSTEEAMPVTPYAPPVIPYFLLQKPAGKPEERPLDLTVQKPSQASIPPRKTECVTPFTNTIQPKALTPQESFPNLVPGGAMQETSSDSSLQKSGKMVLPQQTSDCSQTMESKMELLQKDMEQMKIARQMDQSERKKLKDDVEQLRRHRLKDREDTHREMEKLGEENADLKLILEKRTKEIEKLKSRLSELERIRAEKEQLSIEKKQLLEKVDSLCAKNEQLSTSHGQLASEVMKFKQNAEKEKQLEEENKQLKTALQASESMIRRLISRLKKLDPEFAAEKDARLKEETVDGCVGFLNTSHVTSQMNMEPKPPKVHDECFKELCDIPAPHVDSEFCESIKGRIKGILMVVNEAETRATLSLMQPIPTQATLLTATINDVTFTIGMFGAYCVGVIRSSAGDAGLNGAKPTLIRALQVVQPIFVISVGVCFGKDKSKQRLGDIIVANIIRDTTYTRKGMEQEILRSPHPSGSHKLLGRFGNSTGFRLLRSDNDPVKVKVAPMITVAHLIDNEQTKKKLFELCSDAEAGEMEGAGILSAVQTGNKPEAIVIKAIVDWADGTKDKEWQPFGAHAAASYVLHHLGMDNL